MAECGTYTKYTYGCRCSLCVDAQKARRKDYYERNKDKILEKRKVYYTQNKSRIDLQQKSYFDKAETKKVRAYRRSRSQNAKFGISDVEYASLLTYQNNACAVCRCEFSKTNRRYELVRDHLHDGPASRDNFRGFLCRMCNIYLGCLEQRGADIQAFIDYINDPPAKKVLK